MTKYYRDAGNRSVSDEQIAREWIREHPDEAARLVQSTRGRPPEARPFVIHGKATEDGRVRIERADPN